MTTSTFNFTELEKQTSTEFIKELKDNIDNDVIVRYSVDLPFVNLYTKDARGLSFKVIMAYHSSNKRKAYYTFDIIDHVDFRRLGLTIEED
ncbi:hypothetical protein [Alkalihalobacillus sp. 1P02AB]|uniref:hypothetical protein n=1 Tax=Alkalihalobacillus sp. 1P02AB TaxID=3132260 RepID=UPI0039A60DEE